MTTLPNLARRLAEALASELEAFRDEASLAVCDDELALLDEVDGLVGLDDDTARFLGRLRRAVGERPPFLVERLKQLAASEVPG